MDEYNIRLLEDISPLILFLFLSPLESLLQVINFADLNAHSVLFFRTFFNTLFTQFPEDNIHNIFLKLIGIKESNIVDLREGIANFLLQESNHAKKNSNKNNSDNNNATTTSNYNNNSVVFQQQAKMIRKILETSLTNALL